MYIKLNQCATAKFNTRKIYLEGATAKFNTRETYLEGATAKFKTRETQKFRGFLEPLNLVPAKFSTFKVVGVAGFSQTKRKSSRFSLAKKESRLEFYRMRFTQYRYLYFFISV